MKKLNWLRTWINQQINIWLNPLPLKFHHWFICGLCLGLLWACGGDPVFQAKSFDEAYQVAREKILPQITVDRTPISEQVAARYSTEPVAEPLPQLEDFPLYAAQPPNDPKTIYLEIFSSSEKANAQKQNERWLIDVAEAFNAKKMTVNTGQVIQVGVRQVPSGTAVRLLTAGAVQPTGYSPSNDLWVQMLQAQGVKSIPVVPRLVPNTAGFAVQSKTYQDLMAGGEATFDRLLDAILSGKLAIGYPNPYASSTALNLLYTLFWRSAGHQQDGKALSLNDLQSPQVNSVFAAFQKQVLITTLTTLDLQELFIRDQQKLQAFPIEYQNYQLIKQLPGFETTAFIPFGVPHNNPLVGFEWNTPAQKAALKQFGDFATSAAMQQLSVAQGFGVTDYLKSDRFPPFPSGEVLKATQTYWKQRKDSGRSVSMMIVVDTSGSMDGDRMNAVKAGLSIATGEINAGNQVGLVTFSDRTKYVVPLAPFDTLQHQRLLAAIDTLQADGGTAMYDGILVGLTELMAQAKANTNGRFYLLVLSDGETNAGLKFDQVQQILGQSNVRIYPIAYGEVNQQELESIAKLREATVKSGTPKNVQTLLKDLFQANL